MTDDEFKEDWPRLDRTVISIGRFDEPVDDLNYWLSRPPAERMWAIEYLRRVANRPTATARLQRVLESAQRSAD